MSNASLVVVAGDVTRLHRFIVRKNFFSFFGQTFRILDDQWNVLLVSRLKAFKLKEDIRVYADEARTREVLSIKARQMLDFSASYDVVDSATGTCIGVLKPKYYGGK